MASKSAKSNNWFYHLVAFGIVTIWGSTFVFTKMLLQAGLSPAQIFTLRFLIAYFLLLGWDMRTNAFSMRWFCSSLKDELLMVTLGITGGSVYFLAENAAMLYTTATNTSLIVCSCPLFTMLLVALFYRQSERFSKMQVLGSAMAFLGMAIVVLNGRFVLHLSPKGDLLAFGACLCWAFYSLLMKPVLESYSTVFITRKVFFYGLLTIIPYFLWHPEEANLLSFMPANSIYIPPTILYNLLFLGIVASMLCFLLWTWVMRKLGPVVATNYVYINPIATVVFAWWLLSEQITPFFVIGSVLILMGMYLADRKR